MEKDKNKSATENKEELFVDKITQERIRQHLADPNSKITEEDITRVNTEIFRRPLTEEEQKAEEELNENLPPKAGSAWDING